jgi:predicted enzyme related to lactoylglutathione lyase
MKITLTSIPVDDPIKAFKFYTEILGFIEKMYIPEASLAIVASPEEPEGTGLLLEPRGNSYAKTYQEFIFEAGLPVIVFGVEDIQAEFARLKELGVEFKSEPTKTEWGTQALFNDTCGNYIQLYHLTQEAHK